MAPDEREAVPDEVWRRLGETLSRPLVFIGRAEREEELRAWTAIRDLERSLDDRLSVGLVGGTGVGKSTLINALAGEEISTSGDRRPTTDRVVAYRHRATPLPDVFPRADLAEPEVVHDKEALERVVVLDFPDFDSVEELHLGILERYLPHLDVLLVVVDDVKYGDSRLFDLLRRLPQNHGNLHGILNKVDRLERRYPDRWQAVGEEILSDFASKLVEHAGIRMPRSRLHGISARAALLAASRASGPSPGPGPDSAGEFEELVRFLEGYRLEKRRRAAKELNIEARKAAFVGGLRDGALDPARAGRISALLAQVDLRSAEVDRILQGIAPGILRPDERRRIVSESLGRTGSRFGFPLDLILGLGREIGRLRGARARATRGAALTAERAAEHYRPYFEGVENLLREAEVEAGDRISFRDGSPPPGRAGEGVFQDVEASVRRRIAAEEERLAKRSRIWNHLLALIVLGLFLWSFLYPLLRGAAERLLGEGRSSWGAIVKDFFLSLLSGLDPSFLVGFMLAIVLAYVAAAAVSWVRQVDRIERAVTEAEEEVRAKAAAHGEAVKGKVGGLLRRWLEEREEIRRLLEAPEPP